MDSKELIFKQPTILAFYVCLQLTLPAILADRPRLYGNDFNIDDAVLRNLRAMAELEDRGSHLGDNDYYEEFCVLFNAICGNKDLLKICKERYSSQISRGGRDLIDTISTFFQMIYDQISFEDVEEETTLTGRMARMSQENEFYKATIMSLKEQNDKIVAESNEEVREFEKVEKQHREKMENLIRKNYASKAETEVKNKNDMLLHFKFAEIDLDELEIMIKENQTRFNVLKEAYDKELGPIIEELTTKESMLKMAKNSFINDMISEYKKKKSLQLSVITKINLLETLKNKVTSMETYLGELEDEEKAYMKRELYDRLDAIRIKIALRTITKFLMPYVNLKFKSRKKKQKVSGKNKTVKKKK